MKTNQKASFTAHATFMLVMQTHGRDEKGAIQNMNNRLDEELVKNIGEGIKVSLDCQIEKATAKEIDNGWFEVQVPWTGKWAFEATDENAAKKEADQTMDQWLTPFYQFFEGMASRGSRIQLVDVSDEEVTKVTPA